MLLAISFGVWLFGFLFATCFEVCVGVFVVLNFALRLFIWFVLLLLISCADRCLLFICCMLLLLICWLGWLFGLIVLLIFLFFLFVIV